MQPDEALDNTTETESKLSGIQSSKTFMYAVSGPIELAAKCKV